MIERFSRRDSGTLLIGMVVMRYVLRVPGLADASVAEVVGRLGPVLQQHLLGTVDTDPVPGVDFIA